VTSGTMIAVRLYFLYSVFVPFKGRKGTTIASRRHRHREPDKE